MRWLKRWQASKMHPLGPDFDSAPWMEFDLSGTKVKFRCPRHEVPAPAKQFAEKVDLYNPDHFKENRGGESMGLTLLYRGWSFWDRPFGEKDIGTLEVRMVLTRKHPHVRQFKSFYAITDIQTWILEESEKLWGTENREMWEQRDTYEDEIDPDADFLQYPRSVEEVDSQVIHGSRWFFYKVFKPSDAPRWFWDTAISDDHILTVVFEPGSVMREYFSPEHDIDSAVVKTMYEFIANVHIKLSTDAERCKQAALAG
ncbi:hypothetical protein BTA51_03185 [Hahella sp. CCB-MM4]|uniref:hypothetical protein n=1 Tax=Hahella sp. (strain CCB-MM4) TaxID=1926491 RepID=UPI000BD5CE8C|nr:hypothetical protein [Hahella sp. CCB-MM4]OZG75395.1 hypothetical protein BTA51_03185 [Hahella sp. CCB-MM4]